MSNDIFVTKRGSNALRPLADVRVVCWQVRDMVGNDYGTFKDRGNAMDFGGAVADKLGLDEMRYRRVLIPSADCVQTEVLHVRQR